MKIILRMQEVQDSRIQVEGFENKKTTLLRFLQISPISSPRRKPGTRGPQQYWIPAFAGMTLQDFCKRLFLTLEPSNPGILDPYFLTNSPERLLWY
jgi:hypothetical protein